MFKIENYMFYSSDLADNLNMTGRLEILFKNFGNYKISQKRKEKVFETPGQKSIKSLKSTEGEQGLNSILSHNNNFQLFTCVFTYKNNCNNTEMYSGI